MFPPPRTHPTAAGCQARQNVVDVGRRDPWEMSSLGAYVVKTATKGMVLVPGGAVSHGSGDFYLKNAQSMRLPSAISGWTSTQSLTPSSAGSLRPPATPP